MIRAFLAAPWWVSSSVVGSATGVLLYVIVRSCLGSPRVTLDNRTLFERVSCGDAKDKAFDATNHYYQKRGR